MVIDALMIFGYEALDYFKRVVLSSMNGELMTRASASPTDEQQSVWTRLASALKVEISFEGSQIKANAGVDRSKLTSNFAEKYSAMIDSVEMDFEKKNNFYLEMAAMDMLEWPEIHDRLMEQIKPYVETELAEVFGGGS